MPGVTFFFQDDYVAFDRFPGGVARRGKLTDWDQAFRGMRLDAAANHPSDSDIVHFFFRNKQWARYRLSTRKTEGGLQPAPYSTWGEIRTLETELKGVSAVVNVPHSKRQVFVRGPSFSEYDWSDEKANFSNARNLAVTDSKGVYQLEQSKFQLPWEFAVDKSGVGGVRGGVHADDGLVYLFYGIFYICYDFSKSRSERWVVRGQSAPLRSSLLSIPGVDAAIAGVLGATNRSVRAATSNTNKADLASVEISFEGITNGQVAPLEYVRPAAFDAFIDVPRPANKSFFSGVTNQSEKARQGTNPSDNWVDSDSNRFRVIIHDHLATPEADGRIRMKLLCSEGGSGSRDVPLAADGVIHLSSEIPEGGLRRWVSPWLVVSTAPWTVDTKMSAFFLKTTSGHAGESKLLSPTGVALLRRGGVARTHMRGPAGIGAGAGSG